MADRKYRLKKRRTLVEHDDSEGNWLISYADLMTLLWGFFVILSAMSIPNPELIEKLKQSTSVSMGGEYEQPFNEITDRLLDVLKSVNLEEEASVEVLTDGVKITMKSGHFFQSGSSDLNSHALSVLTRIGDVIKDEGRDFKVLVEGHTDDIPMKSKETPSNWELSSDRASTVVRLFESRGVDHSLLRPIGLADVDPLVDIQGLDNAQLREARAKNRRIVVRLQKKVARRSKKAGEQ